MQFEAFHAMEVHIALFIVQICMGVGVTLESVWPCGSNYCYTVQRGITSLYSDSKG